ncbi:PAS/PAC sensor Signal transduction histidine kinase [uncultured Alphaproteobacteria bacterium]|uniref:histidine kinase n=1 Tax=uncultured Alphaproteobacteria bacterium TaxID=91750 RepID=A0A212KKS1_9PROT|nr:PAS/PAC sensor Signal transduction histidine kinase [uncultured Alphaproteobacteria bacterium]
MPDAAMLAQQVRVEIAPGGRIDPDAFVFPTGRARFAVAFVSPFLDFAATAAGLAAAAGPTPLVAAPSAGEIAAPGGGPLYRPCDAAHADAVVAIFPPDLIAAVHLLEFDLGAREEPRAARAARLAAELDAVRAPFPLDVRDTLALTFCDGSTGGEALLTEAVFACGRLPLAFVGGSAGAARLDAPTPVWTGRAVRHGHAVTALLKLAPGRRYGLFKSHNFRPSARTFVVVDADVSRRVVSTLLDAEAETARPAAAVLADRLGVARENLAAALAGYSFGIDIAGEIFVRSVREVGEDGALAFFCDVHPGDQLVLIAADDFVATTRADVARFFADKPPPLGALAIDCILRRVDNAADLDRLAGTWPCPVAGFSSFGEMMGVSLNQTLTAVAFFDARGGDLADDLIDRFPVHYAHWQAAATLAQLRRMEIINRLRADTTRRLTHHLGASAALACEIEGMLTHESGLSATLDNIRATIAREVAAERRAHHAEQQLAEAVETLSEGFALYDADDRLVLLNKRFHDMFPTVDRAEAIGSTFEEVMRLVAARGLYGYSGEPLDRFLAARLAAHRAADGSATLQRMADGRWLINRENRLKSGGVVGIRTDVTEIKQREAELERLTSRYELILGAAGDGIVELDAEGRVRFANPAAQTMLAADEGFLLGRAAALALGAPDLPAFPLAGPEALGGELSCARAGGARFTAEYVLTPIAGTGGFAGAVLVFRDISLRKRYEATLANQQKLLEQQVELRTRELSTEIAGRIRLDQALQESRNRLMGITSSLFEGVLLIDGFGVIVFANPSAHRWLGAEVLLERLADEVFQLERDDRAVPFEDGPLRTVIADGKAFADDDAAFHTADGRRLAVAYAAAPLEEAGRRRLAVISFRGIDALKAAQREALQASRLASVGQLAAGVAHEINTPIQYVGDNLRFIQDTFPDIAAACAEVRAQWPEAEAVLARFDVKEVLAEYPDAIGQALQGVGHVTQIVRSMKDFSHPGGGAKVGTDINAAIESTVTVCRNEWKHVAQLTTDLDPALPKILCYPSDIHQVLLNLVINAAHAVGERADGATGRIRIATRHDDGWVEVRVADDGPGVPKALRDRIFDPFFTTKGVGKGTGQGLSICQDIVVRKHGGKLFLDETETQGATFVVRLPIG